MCFLHFSYAVKFRLVFRSVGPLHVVYGIVRGLVYRA